MIVQTAVRVSQGDSLIGCTDELVCRKGIALEPVMFGTKHDPKRLELRAYVLYSPSYLFNRMPLIWWLLLLWCLPVGLYIIWQNKKKKPIKECVEEVNSVSPISAVSSAEVSEWVEIRLGLFFNQGTGILKTSEHEVCLKKNRLMAFICLLEAPDHTLSYSIFCEKVLKRPLLEYELTEKDKMLNLTIKKSMTQTIMRLRADLEVFPELSIENISCSYYCLHIA